MSANKSTEKLTNGEHVSTDGKRARRKAETRAAIVDAALEALAGNSFDRATHEALADKVGVARRTVYRYFPDKDALLRAMWDRVILEPQLAAFSLPEDEGSLTATLATFFTKMDENPLAVTVAMTTPRGRELRSTVRELRAAAWQRAAGACVEKLPQDERELPLAVLQLLRSGFAWLEMRDQWGFDAARTTAAVTWATQALLADLRERGGRSLAQESEPPSG